jgi:protein-S-isoprenylcysteine O-methyltransferase Ste14
LFYLFSFPIMPTRLLVQPIDWAIALYVAGRREETQLGERFAESYRAYKHGAGMIVPSFSRLFARRTP